MNVIEMTKPSDMNDSQLVSICLQGEVDEFKKIVGKYRGKVMALALNILGNYEDAEDACQDSFIQAYRNLDRFDTRKSFSNWLFSILYNRCFDQLRKRSRFYNFFKRVKSDPSFHSVDLGSNQSSAQPLSQSILRELSPKERTVLFLWAEEGYTSEEIASVLRCSSSTVRVHLFKARKKIKSILEK
jgi:RNA polymerase sigma-70 factor (ECF subfamily)